MSPSMVDVGANCLLLIRRKIWPVFYSLKSPSEVAAGWGWRSPSWRSSWCWSSSRISWTGCWDSPCCREQIHSLASGWSWLSGAYQSFQSVFIWTLSHWNEGRTTFTHLLQRVHLRHHLVDVGVDLQQVHAVQGSLQEVHHRLELPERGVNDIIR